MPRVSDYVFVKRLPQQLWLRGFVRRALASAIVLVLLVITARLTGHIERFAPRTMMHKTFNHLLADPSPTIPAISSKESVRSNLHIIIPATSSNVNLCRLLLSATILGYPPAALIMWGEEELEDQYKTHMKKMRATLDYLESLSNDHDSDLALIVDGFDLWLQLGPDVLVKRYYQVIEAENKRLWERLGKQRFDPTATYNSVVFGPDKICWPEDASRPACWAVPESPLSRYAFGPQTDSGQWKETNRPRWLNSGTIIGPIKDVRKVIIATLQEIQDHYTIDSDQYYISNVWGAQEYARKLLAGEDVDNELEIWFPDDLNGQGVVQLVTPQPPAISLTKDVELHITIDYISSLFQTNAFYHPFLTWSTFNGPSSTSRTIGLDWELPQDLHESSPPLSALDETIVHDLQWKDVPLLVNPVTRQIPVVMHFTPPKDTQDLWWSRMWFYPYAEALKSRHDVAVSDTITTTGDGRAWWPYSPNAEFLRWQSTSLGGAFIPGSNPQWQGWGDLCHEHEDYIFHGK